MTLSESLGQQALSITMRASYLSLQLIQKAILGTLKVGAKTGTTTLKKVAESRPKTSLKTLSKYDNLEYLELNKQDYQNLKKNFKKYGVQISAVKDPSKPDEVTIFFKSKNLAQVERAMKDYLLNNVDNIQDQVDPVELEQLVEDEKLTEVIQQETQYKTVTIDKKLWQGESSDPTCVEIRIPYEKDIVKF
ncbi:MAG: DUF3801 domain-containing protein, partial [Gallicola sp.]|nr:DUF3801 domain-containing protein [Gallicola sp.]